MEQYPNLESLSLFIKVVESSSFAKVTRQYNIPKASLSRKISQLEEFYGAQLLVRNTRHVQLTEVGREIFQKFQTILLLCEDTQSVVLKTKEKPQGLLRISAGVEYGLSVISPLVNSYLQLFPNVNVELDLTGRRVDLIYEGFDLGVRIGPLEDSTLAMRKVGSFQYGLYCSPAFLKEHKSLTVEKLSKVPTLGFTRAGNKKMWTLLNQQNLQKVEISPRLVSNNYWALLNAAEAGVGVVFMPVFLAEKSIKKNLIQPILPSWKSEEISVHFVYPSQKFVTSKVRNFIDFAVKKLKT